MITPPPNDRLAELAALKPGWDSYDGKPIDQRALLMAALITGTTPAITPSGDGAILLEWHDDGFNVELWLQPGMLASVIFTTGDSP